MLSYILYSSYENRIAGLLWSVILQQVALRMVCRKTCRIFFPLSKSGLLHPATVLVQAERSFFSRGKQEKTKLNGTYTYVTDARIRFISKVDYVLVSLRWNTFVAMRQTVSTVYVISSFHAWPNYFNIVREIKDFSTNGLCYTRKNYCVG